MPRPLTFAVSAACVGVIGLLVVLALRKDKHLAPAAPAEADPITAPASAERKASDARAAADEKPAPRPPVAAAERSAAQAPAQRDTHEPPDEESLLAQLHELAASDPNLSLRLAREAVNRFPDSANAPEFEWNVVKALFNMGRLEDAEAEARVMLSKYPGSYFTGDVVHHLLNHPPNPPDVP